MVEVQAVGWVRYFGGVGGRVRDVFLSHFRQFV